MAIITLNITEGFGHHEMEQTPALNVVPPSEQGETRTFKTQAQYLTWLRTGRLPDHDDADRSWG